MANRLLGALDILLDQTILLSYTRLGYALRRRSWDPTDLDVNLSGKVCIVTGANAGLGFVTTQGLAQRGATVTMVARNQARGLKAQQAILARTGNPNIALEIVDLSDLGAMRDFARRFQSTNDRLDVLVNNAGVMRPQRELSVDGIEMTFATNVLGAFLLTNSLIPLMKRSAPARIILVSSGGMYAQKLDADDLQFERKSYSGPLAYAQTKRAQVMLTELWAERLAGAGVTVNAMHPGWVDTPGLRRSLPTFYKLLRWVLRTPAQGADTILWQAVAPHLADQSGKFWLDRRPRGMHKLRRTRSTPQAYQQLWDECTQLSGIEVS